MLLVLSIVIDCRILSQNQSQIELLKITKWRHQYRTCHTWRHYKYQKSNYQIVSWITWSSMMRNLVHSSSYRASQRAWGSLLKKFCSIAEVHSLIWSNREALWTLHSSKQLHHLNPQHSYLCQNHLNFLQWPSSSNHAASDGFQFPHQPVIIAVSCMTT